MARHRRYIERPDPGPIAPDLPAPSGSWQDPSVDTENVNAAYRQQFERANAAGAEVERLRDREKEWRRISAEQQADYGQLQAEIERLREDYKRELYEQGKQKHAALAERDDTRAEVERLREAQHEWAQDLLAAKGRADSEVSARVEALIAPMRETLRIARFDAEVPVRELREENDRLRAALDEVRAEASHGPTANLDWIARAAERALGCGGSS